MGTTADKLNKILETKAAIKQAIIDKGVYIDDSTVFADYPYAIYDISADGGGNLYYKQLFDQRTNNGTNMKYLFACCNSPYLDLSGFDTSQATDMSYMFSNCTSQIYIDGWNTSNLTNASYIFDNFTNNNLYIDLSVIDFSNVTNASNVFRNCNLDNIDIRYVNLDLAKVDFASGTNGLQMFYGAKGTLDLSNWYLDSSVTSLRALCHWFYGTAINLTNWNTTNVTNMYRVFYYNPNLEELIIPDWDMTNVTDTTDFFYNCSKLNHIDLSRSNDATIAKIATLVPTRTQTAYGKVEAPVDLAQEAIEALAAKYWKPIGPRIDIISCEVMPELDEVKPGKSTKLYISNCEPWYGDDRPEAIEFFSSNTSVATINGNVLTATDSVGTTEITVRNVYTQEIISEPFTFIVSRVDTSPNVVKFKATSALSSTNIIITVNGSSKRLADLDYNAVTDIYSYDAGAPITKIQFNKDSNLKEIVKFNTSSLTTMYQMFYKYDTLKSLDTSDWDTSNVTDMESTFSGCSALTSLKLSNWNTSKVNDMQYMFNNCTSLKSLDLSNFDMSNVTSTKSMFYNCVLLQTLRLDNCSNTTISKIINSDGFPMGMVIGAFGRPAQRILYCKESEAAGLTAPNGWRFSYVQE